MYSVLPLKSGSRLLCVLGCCLAHWCEILASAIIDALCKRKRTVRAMGCDARCATFLGLAACRDAASEVPRMGVGNMPIVAGWARWRQLATDNGKAYMF